MKYQSALLSLTIVFAIIIGVLLGCGGASENACTGTVVYQGKPFEGKGRDADFAKHNACNNYCRDADPEYEARYGIWLYSPKGKAAGSPSKKEAIFKDKELLDFVTITCANKCVAAMGPEATCK